jgi:ketosteroid isomerase-like protein
MSAMLYPVLAVMLVSAWLPGFGAPNDEEQALWLLRDYEAAVAAYDSEAAMALLADDYRGWRNSGKESVAQMIDRLKEQGSALELDLTEAVVTVDGDSARVSEVGNRMGQWESRTTYLLSRTPDGWKIRGMEMRR